MNDSPFAKSETSETDSFSSSSSSQEEKMQSLLEQFSRLEKVIRGLGKDNLGIIRSQRETQTNVQDLLNHFDELELTVKGLNQTVWRSTQENKENMQNAEQHFADALQALETRIREELQLQIYKNVLQVILPALDDMDLVIGNQKVLTQTNNTDDTFLEAMVLVRNKFATGLQKIGLEEISIDEGRTPFDPKVHEAVESDIPSELLPNKDAAPNTILRVRRAGYRLNGLIFRTPQVLIKT